MSQALHPDVFLVLIIGINMAVSHEADQAITR